MSTTGVTITQLTTYRNEVQYPFCPGCGHGPILDALNEALVGRGVAPAGVVLVSDIGCAGLSDQYFGTSAFHGLHGRSITYASGIKLARPDLDVVVIMGDGGAGIGGAHLINAARRNIGITVLVFNNLNFGMTGGQHSVTTPMGAVTSTTPGGNLERPLDICGTVGVNGAGYVFRGTSFDDDLGDRIAEAIDHGGFALLDIWELCSAYFMRSNRFGKRSIMRTLTDLGFETGVLVQRDLPEYSAAYQAAVGGEPRATRPAEGLHARFPPSLLEPRSIVLAGAAGGRVRSAARLLGRAAILSELWSAQRDDYPVTVKTGHSVSTVMLSPEPIDHVGVNTPDVLVVLSPEGAAKAGPIAKRMSPDGFVFALPEFAGVDAPCRVQVIDPARTTMRIGPPEVALVVVAAVATELDLVPMDALLEAATLDGGAYAERNEQLLAAGAALIAG